tara:strand:+ start:5286 stop:5513 length:228 start_codon:yes stop_codon:yes gene_type:complete
MNKLIFERSNVEELRTIKEPTRIVFEVESNLTIQEYKIACKRLAHAMGYSEGSIVKEFGKDTVTGDPAQLKLLLG